MYQGKTIDNDWTASHEFSSGTESFYRPSISVKKSNKLAMTWDDGGRVYKASYSGSTWSSVQIAGFGKHANLVNSGAGGPLELGASYVATSATGPLYAIEPFPQIFSPIEGAQDTMLGEIYRRRVEAVKISSTREKEARGDTASNLSVELSIPRIRFSDGNVMAVDFVAVNDTLPNITPGNAWTKLSSVPISLTGLMDSLFIEGNAEVLSPEWIVGNGVDTVRLWFDLVDATTGRTLRKFEGEERFWNTTTRSLNARTRITEYSGSTVFIRPALTGLDLGRQDIAYNLIHVHELVEQSPGGLGRANKFSLHSETPSELKLLQNFPNPFNPTTTIKYELPKDSHVSLKVYDVLGREVATLVEGVTPAGLHQVAFNAADLSSGIYFYRLKAGDFTEVKRLLYVKSDLS